MDEFKKNVKITSKYFKGHGLRMFLIVIFTIVILALRIVTPIVSAQVLIKLTDNVLDQVILLAFVLLGIDVLWNICWYFQQYFYEKIYKDVFSEVQNEVGSAILKLTNNSLDENSTGVFIQRLTGDTSNVASSFDQLIGELSGLFTSVGTLVAIFVVSIPAGLFSLVATFISFGISYFRVKVYAKEHKRIKEINEKTTGFIGELVRGARDIKMLNSESSFLKALRDKVDYNLNEDFRFKVKNRRFWLVEMVTMDAFENFMIIFLVWLIMINNITITLALVIRNYQSKATGFADSISRLMEAFKDFNLSCTRIFGILDSDEFPKEQFGTKHLDNVEGNFEFKNVVFSYKKNKKVLNNLSFKAKANTTVGFVGKSGEGKSTIFSLLCKMYDVNKGEILIDGININELDKDSIRGNITIISQNPYIFNLSIRDNLKLVKSDLTNKEMREACKMACLDEFIESLPDKYDTIIGEGGVNLSGGQRQRLAIARAFVQKTEIILFDEATSALDNETQRDIQQAIRNLKKDYTILIIAHRLSTIKDCDKILYISKGQVLSQGTHEQLMKNSKEYKELYESEIEK
ncbi:MAG: ABC transporter ATP-binding protein/permease [Bacilli bacterium]|nr:ABC transporter ATP-binding protein/permease [Bacilli bacterium]